MIAAEQNIVFQKTASQVL